VLFAVTADVVEEEITEHDALGAIGEGSVDRFAHRVLVHGVRAG